MAKTTEEALLDKIDRIFRLIAVVATNGLKRREQIALLSQARLQPKDIADLLGTSSNAVRVELVGLRRKGRRKKGRIRGEGAEEN